MLVVPVCNPSTLEAKAGGPRVQGWPELLRETLSQKKRVRVEQGARKREGGEGKAEETGIEI
jgi:hypothetical protein